MSELSEPNKTAEPRPCLICKKPLESVNEENWDCMQPYDGGEVQFIFSYGSGKYDLRMSNTTFKWVICDECATPMIKYIKEHGTPGKEAPDLRSPPDLCNLADL